MGKKRRKSLLRSILFSSIGALVCMNLVIGLLFTMFVRSNMVERAKAQVYYRVSEQASDMDTWMTKHVTIAENLALTARVDNLRGFCSGSRLCP